MKHRLVGAVVLASVAVIFLPELLDSPKDYTAPRRVTPIPPPPMMSQNTTSKLPPPSDNEPLIPPLPPPSVEPEVQAEIATELSAWVIQLETFTTKKKAERLQDNLRKKGFPAFIETQSSKKATIYQVRVGPELNQAQAVSVANEIAKKFNITGQVEPYPAEAKTLN